MSHWVPFSEAARLAGVSYPGVWHAYRAGKLVARRRPDGRMEAELGSVRVYGAQAAARRARVARNRSAGIVAHSPRRTVDAQPLLEAVEARGGPAACGVRQGSAELEALRLAKLYGRVTPRAGAQLASTVLGLPVREVWPPAPAERRLPVGPLLEQVRLMGGPVAAGIGQNTAEERAFYRAAATGVLTESAADQLAVAIGLTLWDLWPEPVTC